MKMQTQHLPVIKPNFCLIDTHCHLDMASYADDLQEVLDRACRNGVKCVVSIGTDYNSSAEAIKIAAKHTMVKAAVGTHPHDANALDRKTLDSLSALIDEHRDEVVGYGEIGLDYVKQYSPKNLQIKAFHDQLAIAKNFGLPIIIHDRKAHEDTLNMLHQYAPFDNGGIMHCFSGDLLYARKIIDLGLHISIPGIITFKNARQLQEVAQHIPAESILLETDGPFLAPVPYRGKRNEPLYLLYVAQETARLRQISIEEIAQTTTDNARKLFALPLRFGSQ